MKLPYHHEAHRYVAAAPEDLFAYLDDQVRLASHMARSSWRMGGGRMQIDVDAGRGKKVGSHIRMTGRVLGIALSLDEVVTEREPPLHKVWETTGVPLLLVIGAYRMGFTVQPEVSGSHVSVSIDYALPKGLFSSRFGRLLGGYYAKWCTRRMVDDAVKHFCAGHSTGPTARSPAPTLDGTAKS